MEMCGMLPTFALLLCPWHWAQPQCVPTTKSLLLSLPLQFALWERHPDPSLLITSAGAPASSEQRLQLPSASFLHPISPIHSHTHTFRFWVCRFLRSVCVFIRGSFVNYSCPTCSFKGRDLEVLWLHHTAYLTLSSSLIRETEAREQTIRENLYIPKWQECFSPCFFLEHGHSSHLLTPWVIGLSWKVGDTHIPWECRLPKGRDVAYFTHWHAGAPSTVPGWKQVCK